MVPINIGDKMLHCKPRKHAGAKEIGRQMRVTRISAPLSLSQCDIIEHQAGQLARYYFLLSNN